MIFFNFLETSTSSTVICRHGDVATKLWPLGSGNSFLRIYFFRKMKGFKSVCMDHTSARTALVASCSSFRSNTTIPSAYTTQKCSLSVVSLKIYFQYAYYLRTGTLCFRTPFIRVDHKQVDMHKVVLKCFINQAEVYVRQCEVQYHWY